ncbi:MAG TPA: helix-turn-helix domain-containing protein [Bacteroidales bacterium]|nr:helix-turn-helix domain-containing protein [Bacteroidales bacterium]
MINSNIIGSKIAMARKNKNLSQAELAKQIAKSPQAVGKWERGESMPDIPTLNRLAEILGVDLNYFSENFQSAEAEKTLREKTDNNPNELLVTKNKKPGWDLSKLNLINSDFSGLKNLHEKLSSSNIQNCVFVGSELSGLFLNGNNVYNCDFTSSDISNSHIQNSMLNKNDFKNSSLKGTKFSKSFIENCDFTGTDLANGEFINGGFGKNTILNTRLFGTSFINMAIQDIVFEGKIEDSHFENCSFYGVKFQNITLLNTFFKNNKKFKRVKFINCNVDKLTFAFLKNNLADLTGITLVS